MNVSVEQMFIISYKFIKYYTDESAEKAPVAGAMRC